MILSPKNRLLQKISWAVAVSIVAGGMDQSNIVSDRQWVTRIICALMGSVFLYSAWQGIRTQEVNLRGGGRYTKKDKPIMFCFSISAAFAFSYYCFAIAGFGHALKFYLH